MKIYTKIEVQDDVNNAMGYILESFKSKNKYEESESIEHALNCLADAHNKLRTIYNPLIKIRMRIDDAPIIVETKTITECKKCPHVIADISRNKFCKLSMKMATPIPVPNMGIPRSCPLKEKMKKDA